MKGAKRARKPNKPRKKSEIDPRTRILDAAEQLFGMRGFYGTSMRDIALVAEVVPSHVVYNFGTKEKLYAAVFLRRVHELTNARMERLEQVAAHGGDVESVLRAYVAPLLQRRRSDELGWHNYTRLIAQFANMALPFTATGPMSLVFEAVDGTGVAIVKELRRATPGLSKRDALHGFLFFVASMLHMFAETGRLEALSGGTEQSADLEPLCASLIRFSAGGFRALAQKPKAA